MVRTYRSYPPKYVDMYLLKTRKRFNWGSDYNALPISNLFLIKSAIHEISHCFIPDQPSASLPPHTPFTNLQALPNARTCLQSPTSP